MTNLHVEVVYARPEKQTVLALVVEKGTTAKQSIEQSGVLEIHPELELEHLELGIYSRLLKKDEELSDGDRVEIYRPLLADPKEVRKRRAEEAKAAKLALKNSSKSS